MARSYSTVDLVQLPTLDAASAQALTTMVISAAHAENDLPEPVNEALGELKGSLHTLQKVASQRLRASTDDPQKAKSADVTVDACWSGMFGWLSGWAKVPGLPEAELASSLLAQIFPNDSLKFIQAAYVVEWAESRDRLQLIKDQKLDEPIEGVLGGKKILSSLRAAHKAYGDAVGITEVQATEEERASLREALSDLVESLRHYVVQVSATVRKKNPKTAERAAKLLAPITEWQRPGGKSKLAGQPESPSAPASNASAPEKPLVAE